MHKLWLALLTATLSLFPQPSALAETTRDNVVKNSSFEVGMDGYGILRGEYLTAGQKDVPWLPPTPDSTTAYDGAASLRIDNPHSGSWRFFSREFPVDPGKPYVVSFAAKAGLPGQDLVVNLDTASGHYDETGGSFRLTTEWKRYTLGPVKIPGGRPYCTLQMMYGIYSRVTAGTSVWLDALQVEEAPGQSYVPRPLEVGIVNGLKKPYTSASTQDFPIRFLVRNNTPRAAKAHVRFRVTDEYFKRVVSETTLKSFRLNGTSTATQAIANVSPKRRGKYVLAVDLMDDSSGDALDHSEFDFAVIDSVKRNHFTEDYSISDNTIQQGGRPMGPEGESRDIWALFGSSADDFFDLRAEAGDRWIRSWDFNWSNVEPESGQYDWTLTDILVQKAKARGIRIMPVLGDEFILDHNRDPPTWLMAQPGGREVDRVVGGGKVFLPPVEAWTRYVQAGVTRYKGTITTWEVLNEPNLWISPDQYLIYLRSAYKTIKQVDPAATVVAYSSSQDQGGAAVEYLDQCFQKGGLNYCDAVTFHPYAARLDWSKPLAAEELTAKLRTLMNQYGGSRKGLWVGELYYVGQERPGVDDGYVQRTLQGHEYARRYLLDLSTGIGRSFTLPDLNYLKLFLPRSWAVNNHLTGGMIPSTTFVIYNTLTRLFEGARPKGQIVLEGTNKLYLYRSKLGPIAASWSFDVDNQPRVLALPNARGQVKVLDIMGNASDQVTRVGKDLRVTLTNSPIYLLPNSGLEATFRPLLAGAHMAAPAVPRTSQYPSEIPK